MLDNFLGYHITKASLHIKLISRQMFLSEGFDITPEQWALLYALCEEDGQYQNQLADKLLKQKPNITRLIDILQEKKLVTRKADKKDRRASKVYLTEEGKKLAEYIYSYISNFEKKVLQGFTKEEIETFKSFLTKITNNL